MKSQQIKIATLIIALSILLAFQSTAQPLSSIDIAAVRNTTRHLNGINISIFYHFTEKLSAGVEANRFFRAAREKDSNESSLSIWDFDANLHFSIPVHKQLIFYPVTGLSYSMEKERNNITGKFTYINRWSFNTGAGILFKAKSIKPHIEYIFNWGNQNEQFLIAGITLELEWNKKK
jgi:hypothetical protein